MRRLLLNFLVITNLCFIADTVTFDNSYSLFRSKKLHYIVYVTNPTYNLDTITPDADEPCADENHEPTSSKVDGPKELPPAVTA